MVVKPLVLADTRTETRNPDSPDQRAALRGTRLVRVGRGGEERAGGGGVGEGGADVKLDLSARRWGEPSCPRLVTLVPG